MHGGYDYGIFPQGLSSSSSSCPPFSPSSRSSQNLPINSTNLNLQQEQKIHVRETSGLLSRPLLWLNSAAPGKVQHEDPNYGRIMTPDEVVKEGPRPFWRRKWLPLDVLRIVLVGTMHLMCLWAPFYFTWPAFWVSASLAVVTGFGITLSYHRHLSHKSFSIPKWLEYIFAYIGVHAGQANPIDWVSTHRFHHLETDTSRDPHSPKEGFLFSHMNWIFERPYLAAKCGEPNNVGNLRKQPFYVFLEKTYGFGGTPFLIWGVGVRNVVGYHITFLTTSACHLWGTQPWNTGNESRNNWWVAVMTFGEGWHNNHHAFEYSSRHGLEWWQVDMTWGIIKLLEAVGLATDVKLPLKEHKERLSFQNSTHHIT